MTDEFLNNAPRYNLFYNCCDHNAAFRNASEGGMGTTWKEKEEGGGVGDEVTKEIVFLRKTPSFFWYSHKNMNLDGVNYTVTLNVLCIAVFCE
jgi:hypothetical protein